MPGTEQSAGKTEVLDESCRETGKARDMPPPPPRQVGRKTGDCDEDPRIL